MRNNMPVQDMRDQYDDEIDLREFFAVIWAGRIKIVALTAIFAIASVYYALSITDQYKATVLLSSSQSSSGGGLSGALGQLGGLASLAGVSLGSAGGSEGQLAQEIMQSWSFIEGFIEDNNLAVGLAAADGWDRSSNEIKINSNLYDVSKSQWLVENGNTGVLGPPSSWTLFQAFSGMLSVSEDTESGLLEVSIEYISPLIAKQWLDLYVAAINAHMQQREMAKVTRNIEYLQIQIKKTSIAEMQQVFYTIIEEQIKNKMLAEASPEFAFESVGPSMVPEVKSQPKRSLICILGTLLGGMLSVLVVLVMHYGRKSAI
jgi:LPS O-antigen subunit length determinant protein (WzzB/FepE family)